MPAREDQAIAGQSAVEGPSTASLRIWPVIALLPITVVGSVKAAGFTEAMAVDTTVLSMIVLLLASGATLLNRPRYPVRASLPFALFALVALVGLTRSYPGDYQALKARDFFLIALSVVLCIPILVRTLADLRGLLVVWLLGGSSIAFLVLVLGGQTTLALEGRLGIGEATLGPAYAIAFGLLVGVAALGERVLTPLLCVPAIGLSGIALVSIGSRGPLIAVLAGVLAWSILRGIWRARTVILMAVLAAVLMIGFNQATDLARTRIILFQDPAREDLWRTAWTSFLESPLTGVGWGNFGEVSWADYPHNAFLESAAELGLVGLVSFGVLVVVASLRVIRSRSFAEVRVLGGVFVAALMGQMLSTDLANRTFWIAVIPCLLVPVLVTTDKSKSAGLNSEKSVGLSTRVQGSREANAHVGWAERQYGRDRDSTQ